MRGGFIDTVYRQHISEHCNKIGEKERQFDICLLTDLLHSSLVKEMTEEVKVGGKF